MKGKKIVEINEDLPEKFGSWISLIQRGGRAIRSQSEEEEIKIEVFFPSDKASSLQIQYASDLIIRFVFVNALAQSYIRRFDKCLHTGMCIVQKS